jgi:dihydrofolate reductase
MREVIMWNLMSLDGYFEGPQKWDLDFHNTVWGEELQAISQEQLKQTDAILFGRVTYEGMAAYWQTSTEPEAAAMNSLPKVVFSKTLKEATWNNTRLVSGDAAEEVVRLKQQDGKLLFIFGSAELTDSLLKAGLVDELRIVVAPVLLGKGTPLFKNHDAQQSLELVDARPLPKSGAVILRYKPNAA